MKKFKLIQEYPGSPELGTEIFDNGSVWQTDLTKKCQSRFHKPKNSFNPENYPKFWKEVSEKDYEILSFINDTGVIFTLQPNNTYRDLSIIYDEGYKKGWRTLQHILKIATRCKIHSVKRLSDGEIFTIGDKVGTPGFNFPIQEFKVHDGENTILSSSYLTKMSSGKYNTRLRDLQKIKQKLFTTKDNIDLYDGDECYTVHLPLNTKTSLEYSKTLMRTALLPNPSYRLIFAKKENAEEYILMNKPCLSLNDLFSVVKQDRDGDNGFSTSRLGSMFRNLAKTKI